MSAESSVQFWPFQPLCFTVILFVVLLIFRAASVPAPHPTPTPPSTPPPPNPFTLAPTAYVSTSNLIRIRFVADITVLFWVWSVFVLHFGEDIATSVLRCRCCHGAVSGRDMVIVLVIQAGFVCHVRGRVRHYGGVRFVL